VANHRLRQRQALSHRYESGGGSNPACQTHARGADMDAAPAHTRCGAVTRSGRPRVR
jgi:hypothetical protein